MNVVGETVTVLSSTDPTKVGMKGRVLMDSYNMLTIDVGDRVRRVEKRGAAFMIVDAKKVLTGADIAGRLEDRWAKGR